MAVRAELNSALHQMSDLTVHQGGWGWPCGHHCRHFGECRWHGIVHQPQKSMPCLWTGLHECRHEAQLQARILNGWWWYVLALMWEHQYSSWGCTKETSAEPRCSNTWLYGSLPVEGKSCTSVTASLLTMQHCEEADMSWDHKHWQNPCNSRSYRYVCTPRHYLVQNCAWALNAAEQDKLDIFGWCAQWIAARRQYPNIITNETLAMKTQMPPLSRM